MPLLHSVCHCHTVAYMTTRIAGWLRGLRADLAADWCALRADLAADWRAFRADLAADWHATMPRRSPR